MIAAAVWMLDRVTRRDSMSGTLFSELADLGERLERTSKRLQKAELLAEFLSALAPGEIPSAVRLIIGQVFPEWDERSLSISSKAVVAVVDALTHRLLTQHDINREMLADIAQEIE